MLRDTPCDTADRKKSDSAAGRPRHASVASSSPRAKMYARYVRQAPQYARERCARSSAGDSDADTRCIGLPFVTAVATASASSTAPPRTSFTGTPPGTRRLSAHGVARLRHAQSASGTRFPTTHTLQCCRRRQNRHLPCRVRPHARPRGKQQRPRVPCIPRRSAIAAHACRAHIEQSARGVSRFALSHCAADAGRSTAGPPGARGAPAVHVPAIGAHAARGRAAAGHRARAADGTGHRQRAEARDDGWAGGCSAARTRRGRVRARARRAEWHQRHRNHTEAGHVRRHGSSGLVATLAQNPGLASIRLPTPGLRPVPPDRHALERIGSSIVSPHRFVIVGSATKMKRRHTSDTHTRQRAPPATRRE